MKAAVYLRTSDDREGRELGLRRQRDDCLELAGRLGVDVVEVYQDVDSPASTRSRDGRPAYQRMLADAQAGRFRTVIAYSSGRLTRQASEHDDLMELATRHGTSFAYVAPSLDPVAERYPASIAVTAGDGKERAGGQGAGPRLPPIIGALDILHALINDVAPELKGMFADAAPALEPLAEGVAGLVRKAMPGFRELIREATPLLTELGRSLPPLGDGLSRFLSSAAKATPGASAFASDVIALTSGQAELLGAVIRRSAQTYLVVRTFVVSIRGRLPDVGGRTGGALDVLPDQADFLVVTVFDQVTRAIGVGIGSAVKLIIELPGDIESTVMSVPDKARSTLAVPLHLADEAISVITGSVRGTVSLLWKSGRQLVNRQIGDVGSAAVTALERAVENIMAGAREALVIPAPTHAWISPPPAAGVTAPPAIALNGLNINLYGVWDLSDPATFDRVAAGLFEALNRYRQGYSTAAG
jgi:hypothetical protein